MGKISMVDLNKAVVLAALYNASKPQGAGFMHYDPKPMTPAEAETLLKRTSRFDYLKGRVMKVDLSGDEFDTWGYDRDNGENAAECVIAELRRSGDTNSSIIQTVHHVNTLESAEDVKSRLDEASYMETNGNTGVLHLGLAGVADKLGPAVDNAVRKRRS